MFTNSSNTLCAVWEIVGEARFLAHGADLRLSQNRFFARRPGQMQLQVHCVTDVLIY